eukprot:GHRR01025757.1.p1 GENE.GHRR01025757.1~~GHRR01025757.1.p1  ORF type:complete len:180 (+),score=84.02 GHRR01025757.1:1214-1753(+)
MLSGITLAAKAIKPGIIILAAEPGGTNNAPDAAAGKAAGRLIQDMPKPLTIADGLQARLGQLTWPVVRDLVDGVVVITDERIVAAMKLIFERMKVVVEPSGAAGLAAMLAPEFTKVLAAALARVSPQPAERANGVANGAASTGSNEQQRQLHIGVILCGGNLDFEAKGFWDMKNWQPAS